AEPGNDSRVAGRKIAAGGRDIKDLPPIVTVYNDDACTNALPIRFGTDEPNSQPVILSSVVAQDHRRVVQRTDYDVGLSIIVQISERSAARRERNFESRPGGGRYIHKAFSGIAHQQGRLFVFQVSRRFFDGVEHMTLGDENIAQPIVVHVDKMRS